MIRHIWTVVCSTSIVDKRSNNISLVNVLERLNLPPDVPLPLSLAIPLQVVTLWSRIDLDQPAKGRGRLTIINAMGDESILNEVEIDLVSAGRSRHRASLQGLTITGPGVYQFQVELIDDGSGTNSGIVAQVPIEVRIVSP